MDAIFDYFDGFLKISHESKEAIATDLEYEIVRKGGLLSSKKAELLWLCFW